MTLLRRSLTPVLLLAALAAIAHLCTRPQRRDGGRGAEVTLEVAREVFATATELGPVLPGEPIEVRDAQGSPLGTLLETTPFAAALPGYAGPVPCVIGIAPDRHVVGIALLANSESPTFIDFLIEAGFLGRWNGLSIEAAAAQRVDAVSGATATCTAVADSVHQTLAAQAAAKVSEPTRSARVAWTQRLSWAVLALAFASAALGWLIPGLRLLNRLATLIVFGFVAGTCLSLATAQSWLARGVPWARFPLLATMALAAVALAVLLGKGTYCAHVCPYGSAQDLAAMLWRWRRPRLPRPLAWVLRTVRGAGVVALFVALVAGLSVDPAGMEPFAAFQWRSAPVSALWLGIAFVLVSVLYPRTWCQHLCPTGYLLETCRGLAPAQGGWQTPLSFERGALAAALAAAIVLALQRPAATAQPTPAGPLPGVDMGLALAEPTTPHTRPIPDVLTAIHERRSVRHYTDDPVLPAQLDTLVRAGMAAPTAGNAQPWAFVVVTEQARLLGLAEALPYGKMLAKAGAAIVVCGVPAKALPGDSAPLWMLDCALAAENILLAAQGIGLGAVWVGVYPHEDRMSGVRTICGIPPEVQPVCVISLGVPAGVEQAKDKYAAENVHWEKW